MRQKFRGLYDTITNSINTTQQQLENGHCNEISEDKNDKTINDDGKVKIPIDLKSKNDITKEIIEEKLVAKANHAESNESNKNLTEEKSKSKDNFLTDKAVNDTIFQDTLKEKAEKEILENINTEMRQIDVNNVNEKSLKICTSTETLDANNDENEFTLQEDSKRVTLSHINEDVSKEKSTNEISEKIQDTTDDFENKKT